MTVYDMTVILSPQVEEGGFDARIQELVDLVGKNGGKLIRENRMGMRRLAYEMRKVTQGYYVSLVFEGTGETVAELERRLRLDESCLRFLTCRYRDFAEQAIVKSGKLFENRELESAPKVFDRPEEVPDIEETSEILDEPEEDLL